MGSSFGPLPTLREFLAVALSLGCEVVLIVGVEGPNGALDRRCLIGPPPKRIPYPLPAIEDTHFVYPKLVGSIERTLGIKTGFSSA